MNDNSRPPLSEMQMARIERQLYPNWHPPNRLEGVELDISMERMKSDESNTRWLNRQSRGLHREFAKRQ